MIIYGGVGLRVLSGRIQHKDQDLHMVMGTMKWEMADKEI